MIAAGSRSERTGNEQDLPPGRPKWIGVRSTRSNVIEPHAVVAPSAPVTMVPIAVAPVAVAAASVVLVVAEVSEEAVVVFVEVVAGANGTGAIPKRRRLARRAGRGRSMGRCHARA